MEATWRGPASQYVNHSQQQAALLQHLRQRENSSKDTTDGQQITQTGPRWIGESEANSTKGISFVAQPLLSE
jgi:hypothetical protein